MQYTVRMIVTCPKRCKHIQCFASGKLQLLPLHVKYYHFHISISKRLYNLKYEKGKFIELSASRMYTQKQQNILSYTNWSKQGFCRGSCAICNGRCTWDFAKWQFLVILTVTAFGVAVRRAKDVEHSTRRLSSETVHVSTLVRVQNRGPTRRDQLRIHLNLSQL